MYKGQPNQAFLAECIRALDLCPNLTRFRLTPSAVLPSFLRTLSAPPPTPDFYWPGDADPDTLSDEEIVKYIRRNAQSPWHPVSAHCAVVFGLRSALT